jgi:hypothetical protein
MPKVVNRYIAANSVSSRAPGGWPLKASTIAVTTPMIGTNTKILPYTRS